MVRSAKVTPGPVGKGTQFRLAVRSRGRARRDGHRVHRLAAAIPAGLDHEGSGRVQRDAHVRAGWRWHPAAVVTGRPVHLATAAAGTGPGAGERTAGTSDVGRAQAVPGALPAPAAAADGNGSQPPGQGRAARRCWPRAWPGWRSPRLRCGGPAAAAAGWWQPAAGRCSGAFVRSTAVRTWRSGYTFDAGRPPARRRRSGRASALAAAGTERRSWAAARTRPLAESRAVPDREGGVRRSRAGQEVPWTVSC